MVTQAKGKQNNMNKYIIYAIDVRGVSAYSILRLWETEQDIPVYEHYKTMADREKAVALIRSLEAGK